MQFCLQALTHISTITCHRGILVDRRPSEPEKNALEQPVKFMFAFTIHKYTALMRVIDHPDVFLRTMTDIINNCGSIRTVTQQNHAVVNIDASAETNHTADGGS